MPARSDQDEREQQRGSRRVKLVALVGYLAVGAALGAFLQRIDVGMDLGGFLVLLVAAMVFAWLHILIHEFGHALAGVSVGMRIIGLGVGPWRLNRTADGWAMRKEKSITGIDGFAVLLPGGTGFSRARQAVYLLGGPLANLLLGGLALLALMHWVSKDSALALVVAAFAMMGLAIGLINLLPLRAGGWNSDGRQLWLLWRNRAEAWAVAYLMRYCALANLGVLPRDWPVVEDSVLSDPRLPDTVADGLRAVAVARALDRKAYFDSQAQDAVGHLVERFWSVAAGMRPILATLLASWCQEARKDSVRAEAWLALSEDSTIDIEATRATIRAQAALQRGDLEAASGLIQAARAAGPRLPDPASRGQLAEELANLEQQLASLRATSLMPPDQSPCGPLVP